MSNTWTKQQVLGLLDSYKKFDVLYNYKHQHYHNKLIRQKALQQICNELAYIRPNTTGEDIKTKINTLRTQFNKALAVTKNNNSNTPKENLQVASSNFWCFENMLFLVNHVHNKKNVLNNSTINNSTEEIYLPDYCEPKNNTSDDHCEIVVKTENDYVYNEIEYIQTDEDENVVSIATSCQTYSNNNENLEPPKKKVKCTDQTTSSTPCTNEWDTFGQFVANQMKNLKLNTNKRKLQRDIIKAILRYQEMEDDL